MVDFDWTTDLSVFYSTTWLRAQEVPPAKMWQQPSQSPPLQSSGLWDSWESLLTAGTRLRQGCGGAGGHTLSVCVCVCQTVCRLRVGQPVCTCEMCVAGQHLCSSTAAGGL